ncbi:MAG: DUF2889 domain-containing protein [Rhodocyclaceae bacterium]|jgi:hypothetical protein
MPLPPPTAERTLIHLRSVQLNGYKRVDGRWDIEARITDTKNHEYPISSKVIAQGEPVHDMWVRITIDAQMNVLEACASSDAAPYDAHCTSIAPDYGKYLAGLNLFHGFRKAVKERLSGIHGCSHITELVMYLPTAALQTFASDVQDNADSGNKPFQLDRCHALESHSEAVQRYYPRWYRGQKTG